MDIFSKMFDDMWMSDVYVGEKLMHCFQAEHLHNNGIYIGLSPALSSNQINKLHNEKSRAIHTQVNL